MALGAGVGSAVIINVGGLEVLLGLLTRRFGRVFGPTVRDEVIVYDEIAKLEDLPKGKTDDQSAGRYRLERRDDGAFFGFAVGPQSWKQFLHPPVMRLWEAKGRDGTVSISPEANSAERIAFIGVRACELHAIAIQDRVFLGGPYVDSHYRLKRENAFLIAVNCGTAGGTCFCASMHTGPKVEQGFDLALTELIEDGNHRFLLEIGSDEGAEIAGDLPSRPAAAEDMNHAKAIIARTEASMGRAMKSDDLHELLMSNLEHPRWDDVAERCLTCGNCTMVCPTCFCTSVEDTSDLSGEEFTRTRRWDSCFTMDFTYLHGGSVRSSNKSRYRQWMTHKLATWIDQFGTSGCVGCGRCITWCPVGIDITAEVRAIRGDESQ